MSEATATTPGPAAAAPPAATTSPSLAAGLLRDTEGLGSKVLKHLFGGSLVLAVIVGMLFGAAFLWDKVRSGSAIVKALTATTPHAVALQPTKGAIQAALAAGPPAPSKPGAKPKKKSLWQRIIHPGSSAATPPATALIVTQPELTVSLTPAAEQEYEEKYSLTKGTLAGRAKGARDVLKEEDLDPAPYGGSVLATQDAAGATHIDELVNARPRFEFGGQRELGGFYDAAVGAWGAYYQQDVMRFDSLVGSVSPFISVGSRQAAPGTLTYGLRLQVGYRWP